MCGVFMGRNGDDITGGGAALHILISSYPPLPLASLSLTLSLLASVRVGRPLQMDRKKLASQSRATIIGGFAAPE